mgnify:CR=1 FL=1
MSKIKIYELAKELDKPSKELVEFLNKKDVEAKTHMSTIDEAEADMVRKAFAPKANAEKAEEEKSDAPKKKKIVQVFRPQNTQSGGRQGGKRQGQGRDDRRDNRSQTGRDDKRDNRSNGGNKNGKSQNGRKEVRDERPSQPIRPRPDRIRQQVQQMHEAEAAAAAQKKRLEQEKKEQEKNVQHKRLGDLPVYIDTKKNIYGKNIKETPKNIADIRIDDGVVTVWGDVLKHEAKETRRGGNKIFTFDITDYTSSVTCKMFDSNSVIDAIVNRLSSAKTVMVTGRYQLDKYTNEYLILPDGIASVLKAEKEDNAPEKRVELHLHTSLSAMDGISSPTALVNRAAKWGHKAIAVTDHGVVQALPEASKAAKSAGIKLICGMEGYLVDDEKYPDFMHMKTRDFKRNHIIFLIKNLEGRKVLYKHISASNVKYYKNRPLIPKSILRQHRNGIVIGSACEQGEVSGNPERRNG